MAALGHAVLLIQLLFNYVSQLRIIKLYMPFVKEKLKQNLFRIWN